MKPYRTKDRLILAAVIVAVHAAGASASPLNGADLTLEDGSKFFADDSMTARLWPSEGDYLVKVENPDGSDYWYLNPKAVFEAKYEPSEMVSSEPVPPEQQPLTPEQTAAFTGIDQAPAVNVVELTREKAAEFMERVDQIMDGHADEPLPSLDLGEAVGAPVAEETAS